MFLSSEAWREWVILNNAHPITGENGGCGQEKWVWLPNFHMPFICRSLSTPLLNPGYATAGRQWIKDEQPAIIATVLEKFPFVYDQACKSYLPAYIVYSA